MPTITFSFTDLQKLVGKKLDLDETKEIMWKCKGEVEGYDKDTDELKVDVADTNLPCMWSIEGVARTLKGALGIETGLPKIEIKKSKYELTVDKSVKDVRPYISAFVAKGHKVDDYLIKQIIQLQEKLCETYGKRRQKIAIGIYRYSKIKFPVHYKATEPESIKFTPLDFKKEMTQQETLEEHPKGKEYAWILEGKKKYPLLLDDNGGVLSFPPIINSNDTGKVEIGDSELMFECTGEDQESLLLATNIFAQAFFDRGFEIYSVKIKYPEKKDEIETPLIEEEEIKLDLKKIKDIIGIDIKEEKVKELLGMARYGYSKGIVKIPCYRKDVMHQVDVIEDIAIMHGYDNIETQPITCFTIGEQLPIIKTIDRCREIMVGLEYQEIFSPILTNKKTLFENMNTPEFNIVEIEKPMSDTYSVLRNWLIPILLEALSKNKHVEYPHKIFEQGLVVVNKKDGIKDYERIAAVSANHTADFTEAKQSVDLIMRMLGKEKEYHIEEVEHDSFIPGRVGRIVVGNTKVGYVGEIAPQVLTNLGIEMPVSGFEINLTEMTEKTRANQ
ncbi:MAG: phenylalanine--tRNA ligase subunit beta [Nanoarchaeota archaeon]|nr:phenylalanine--tRNA ligase subunit beta [Nanoarchaeota archaeon]